MELEVRANIIYTPKEAMSLLKISKSTFLRLVKKGVLSACKIGGQYRILGSEILSLFNPTIRKRAEVAYNHVAKKIINKIYIHED